MSRSSGAASSPRPATSRLRVAPGRWSILIAFRPQPSEMLVFPSKVPLLRQTGGFGGHRRPSAVSLGERSAAAPGDKPARPALRWFCWMNGLGSPDRPSCFSLARLPRLPAAPARSAVAPAALSAPFSRAEVPRDAGAAPRGVAAAEGQRPVVRGPVASSSLGEFLDGSSPFFPSGSPRDDAGPPRCGRFSSADGPSKAEGPLSAPAPLSALRDSAPFSTPPFCGALPQPLWRPTPWGFPPYLSLLTKIVLIFKCQDFRE